MSDPLPVDADTARQLYLSGQLTALVLKNDDPRRIKLLVKQIDPDLLQKYVDSQPAGFLYGDQVRETIRITRTLKSFVKE
jgi:hypothetical protein